MSSNKMQWTKPQLIVLTRGTPEESVLLHCKFIGAVATGIPVISAQTGCDSGPDNKNCGACRGRSGT